MNKKILLLSALLFVFFTPVTSAHDEPTSSSAKPHDIKQPVMRVMEQKENFKIKKEESKEKYQEKIDAMRLEFKAKREEFKAKLAELKDTRKKNIVEHVDLKLSNINKNSTARMSQSLSKLDTLLEKFSSRAAILKTEGKDTTEVDAAIVTAKAAIKTATEAVAIQAAREYAAEIKDEQTLKNTVGEAVKSLRQDLKATQDQVKIAKEKVMDVARALAKLHSPKTTSTPSAAVESGI